MMDNPLILQSNATQVSMTSAKLIEYSRWTLIFVILVGFGFFTYFITVILKVFFTTPCLRESSRYVLFVYLLLNDTFFLLLAFYFVLTNMYKLQVPGPLCYALYTVSSVSFRATSYNLATMALEQYVAICHPLRHVEFCTTFRAHVAFTLICYFSAIPYAVELYVMLSSMTNIFNMYIICWQHLLIVNPIQDYIRSINIILCFTIVGTIILVAYIKIMLVARRVSFQSSSASKAKKTVMLHALQLLLCMASILSRLTENLPVKQFEVLPLANLLIFNCVPRFLSPVIYGICDETLRKHIKRSLRHLFGQNKAKVSR